MNGLEVSVNVEELRKLYKTNGDARRILDHFANRERNLSKTPVERLTANLAEEGHEMSRGAVIGVFKELEKLGCGCFVVGRWSHPSRFEWTVGLVDVGKSAAGEEVDVETVSSEQFQDEEEEEEQANKHGADATLEHLFNLRHDFCVRFRLPKDVTPQEAERSAGFVKTIPFA
jgi:hypothetical protein